MSTHSRFRNLSVGLLGLALLGSASCSKSSSTNYYYYSADLKTMNLPAWQVTNAIPLTPDQAVLAATHYSSTNHPGVTTWDVDSIELSKQGGTNDTWIYSVTLTDRHSGHYEIEIVKVLLDGSVWKPTSERKTR